MPRPQPRHSTSKVSLLPPPYRVYPRLRIYNSKLVITCHTPGPLQNSAIYSRTLVSHCGNQRALQFSSSRTEALDGRHEGSQKEFPGNSLTKLVNLRSQLQGMQGPMPSGLGSLSNFNLFLLLPPSLCASRPGFFAVPRTHQAYSYHMDFALVLLSVSV